MLKKQPEKHVHKIWIRYFNIIVAFIYFILAFVVLINPDADLNVIFILFAISLVLMSSIRIIIGIIDEQIPTYLRVSKIIAGLVIFALAITIIAVPSLDENLVIRIVSLSFIAFSSIKILLAIFVEKYYLWIRILLVAVSAITIVVAGIEVFVSENTQLVFLILISVIFLVNGITRILESIIGYEIVNI